MCVLLLLVFFNYYIYVNVNIFTYFSIIQEFFFWFVYFLKKKKIPPLFCVTELFLCIVVVLVVVVVVTKGKTKNYPSLLPIFFLKEKFNSIDFFFPKNFSMNVVLIPFDVDHFEKKGAGENGYKKQEKKKVFEIFQFFAVFFLKFNLN
jgi:hypothetical protein